MQVSLTKRYAAAQGGLTRLAQDQRDQADRAAQAERQASGLAISYVKRARVSLLKDYVTSLVLARLEHRQDYRDNRDALLRLARHQRETVAIDYTRGGGVVVAVA